ncbi:hypothetical protein Calag_0687 [Caldisphaera lagunensis DSM 15908]|uniref:Uncharacterized protein n=1 Tax=Caldisphaera lagunensis (strain DSM 15908 / JCM 11604 / ANMR 0165 / IC-154) TaxID=1056495 RepID=L0ABB6_CALLD|nr:hypothetical protein [Caldisphaera lagunensis]AFZ70432.1 hypothetical protein Calag_0687 [Caldisphaera lagunensis DSM 15908]
MLSLRKEQNDVEWASKLIDECIMNYKNGNGMNGYLPSCLSNLKEQLNKGTKKENLINYILNFKKIADDLFGKLVSDYNLEYQLPSNVDPKDVAVYVWPSLLSDGNSLNLYSLTLYNWFSFSFKKGDGKSELEPITFLFNKEKDTYKLIMAYARVHYDLCEYNIEKIKGIKVIFARYGHTPYILGENYVRVKCPKVKHSNSRTGRKYWDRMWLAAGNIFTRITGIRKVQFKFKNNIKVYILGCLPKTNNNPFKSPIYPLQFF